MAIDADNVYKYSDMEEQVSQHSQDDKVSLTSS